MLEITPTSRTRGPARLADFVWGGAEWDTAVHALVDGGRRLARSRVRGARRELRHWDAVTGRALDLTVFHLDEHGFVEAERYERRGGPNLHPVPLVLPAVLEPDRVVVPAPGAEVRLTWHGWATFALGGGVEHRPALALEARAGGEVRVQWMVAGVGEVALGPVDGPWARWCVGWRGGDATFLGPVHAPAELPGLPEGGPDAARGLF